MGFKDFSVTGFGSLLGLRVQGTVSELGFWDSEAARFGVMGLGLWKGSYSFRRPDIVDHLRVSGIHMGTT